MADRYCNCFQTELTFDDEACFDVGFEDNNEWTTSMEQVVAVDIVDYDDLTHKPSINGVELAGDKTSEELHIVYRGTTEYWNSQAGLVAQAGALYIYTDYQTVDNGDGTYTIYPGIKIGDGTSYLIDMPFVAADNPVFAGHILDNTVHITQEERDNWNSKWTGYIDGSSPENLNFTTDRVVLGGNLYA